MRAGLCAALLVCVLTDGGPVAAQTAGIPQAPAPQTPSSGGALQWPTGWPDLDGERRQRRSAVVIAVPSPTDALGLPKGWTFRFESPATCATCPDRTGVGTVWHTSAMLAWQVDGGAVGVRVTGERGARLPLFMRASFVPQASDVILSDARTHWVVTLSAERRVWASRDRTLSAFGDLFLPLGSVGRAPTTEDARTPPQTALIGGVRIRSKAPLP